MKEQAIRKHFQMFFASKFPPQMPVPTSTDRCSIRSLSESEVKSAILVSPPPSLVVVTHDNKEKALGVFLLKCSFHVCGREEVL